MYQIVIDVLSELSLTAPQGTLKFEPWNPVGAWRAPIYTSY
jgi:hypothetical protein